MPADVTLPDDFRSVLYNHFIRRYAAIQLRQIIECHLRVLGCKVVYPLFQFSPGAVRAASLPYLSLDWRSLPFPTAFLAFPPDALRATCHDIRWGQVAIPLVIPFLRNIGIACSQVRPTGNDYLSKTSGTPLAVPFLAEPSSPAIPAYRAFPCVFLITDRTPPDSGYGLLALTSCCGGGAFPSGSRTPYPQGRRTTRRPP